MADRTPLLLSQPNHNNNNNNSCDSETLPLPQNKRLLPSLNSTIEHCIGDFNWTQFLQAVLVSFAWFFDAQQTFLSVFTDALPPWHYTDSSSTSSSPDVDVCSLPKGSWAWDGPSQASIVSEWALECESPIITGLPASLFFMGCLVGGLLLATLADTSLGRKNMLFFSCLVMSLSSFLTTFSSNVWLYSFLRFMCGFGRATIGTSSLVLATELVGKRWRGQVSVIGFLCFTIGFLSLPAMAYANRGYSWRNLYLWTSVPTVLYCALVKLLVQESPRWLLVRGKMEEAVAALRCIASITQSNLNLAINNVSLLEVGRRRNRK